MSSSKELCVYDFCSLFSELSERFWPNFTISPNALNLVLCSSTEQEIRQFRCGFQKWLWVGLPEHGLRQGVNRVGDKKRKKESKQTCELEMLLICSVLQKDRGLKNHKISSKWAQRGGKLQNVGKLLSFIHQCRPDKIERRSLWMCLLLKSLGWEQFLQQLHNPSPNETK